MKKGLTELVFILDRSGSMSGLESDTIGGFNSMLEKQKKLDAEALVTTVLFNHVIALLHDRVKIQDIEPLTDEDYSVGGCTALVDAIGTTVQKIKDIHRYSREEDVPENTLFVIITDGLENSSRRYDSDTVKAMVKEQQEKGWTFLFLGANIDAVETAAQFGISEKFAAEYDNSHEGIAQNFSSLGNVCASVRYCMATPEDWKADIEDLLRKSKKTD